MASGSSELKEQLRHVCDYRSCNRAFVEKGTGQWEEFWDQVVGPKRDECCFVLEFTRDSEEETVLHRRVVVPFGVSRSVMLRFDHGIRAELSVEVELGEGAQLGIFAGGIINKGSNITLDVRSVQKQPESHFLFYGRMVSLFSSSTTVLTEGHVAGSAEGGSCIFDTQVLQIGEGGNVYGEPRMEVLRGDVIADHGFSVGRIPEDVRTYLESRGLEKGEAENMYAHGFLEL